MAQVECAGGALSEFINNLPDAGLLGFGTGNFSIQSIVTDGIGNLISSGVSSAVYGSDFGEGFLDATESSLVNHN